MRSAPAPHHFPPDPADTALLLMIHWNCWCTNATDALILLNQDQDILADLSIAICSSFIFCMIWSYFIIFRHPEHKKPDLKPKWGDLISSNFMYAFHDIATYKCHKESWQSLKSLVSSEGAQYVILPYDYTRAPTFWVHTGPRQQLEHKCYDDPCDYD